VETGSEQQLQLCGPIQLVRVDFAHDHTLLSIHPAPAAVVVAGFRRAAAETPAIRGGTPSYRRFPTSARCTIESTVVGGRDLADDERRGLVGREARSRPGPRTTPARTPLTSTDGRHRRSDTTSPSRISTPPGRPRGRFAVAPPRSRAPARAADGDGLSAAIVPMRSRSSPVRCSPTPFSRQSHGCHSTIRHRIRAHHYSTRGCTPLRAIGEMSPLHVRAGRQRPTRPVPRRRPRQVCPDALACGSE
jgi:hypothetical protein